MMPRPGPYGPVPWSVPRPWSLWSYVTSQLVMSVYFNLTIQKADWRVWLLSWIIPGGILYLLMRGSKLMWWVSLVFAGFGILGTLGQLAEASGSLVFHHSVVATLLAAGIILLVLPPSRRFFDLEERKTRRDPLRERFG